MRYEVKLHSDVTSFLVGLERSQMERCYRGLKELARDLQRAIPGCHVRKLTGEKVSYRLRVGPYRFFYIIEEGQVLVTAALRKKGSYGPL